MSHKLWTISEGVEFGVSSRLAKALWLKVSHLPCRSGDVASCIQAGPSESSLFGGLDERPAAAKELPMPDTTPIRLKLTAVRVERFKAAFKPEPIRFQPFNVIVGRNGSGKSTVIEALQWIDMALRLDVPRACDQYHGVHDLINVRSPKDSRFFRFELAWECVGNSGTEMFYSLTIREGMSDSRPSVEDEHLALRVGSRSQELIGTKDGTRLVYLTRRPTRLSLEENDRLALSATVLSAADPDSHSGRYIEALRTFWRGAVFLRLSPIELAQGSKAYRSSYEPLLDQEGRTLPALLRELSKEQADELVSVIADILPDIAGIKVSSPSKRGEEVHFSLLERVISRGRSGRSLAPIPSWMLSEGTRRITAILALLRHVPPATLLCIEEIENGLDPWSVQRILKELESASLEGVQVVLTTHSPWLLDHVKVHDILQVERTAGDTAYTRFADKASVRAYQNRVPPGAVYVTEG